MIACCIDKKTGKLIESQSNDGNQPERLLEVLKNNSLNRGDKDVEIRFVSDNEWQEIEARCNLENAGKSVPLFTDDQLEALKTMFKCIFFPVIALGKYL